MLSLFRISFLLVVAISSFTLIGAAIRESQLLECTDYTQQPCSSDSNVKPPLGHNKYHKNVANRTVKRRQLDESTTKASTSDSCTQDRSQFGVGSQPSIVCASSSSSNGSLSAAENATRKPLEIYIINSNSNDMNNIDVGASLTIKCRFFATSNHELKFKLRWLRSVVSSLGLNQSIASSETDSPMTITTASARLWTVQRAGGIDLILNDFKSIDSGDYFCQAVSNSSSILDEKRIHLSTSVTGPIILNKMNTIASENDQEITPAIDNLEADQSHYSQENLIKLLPSLTVIPKYSELAPGESIQLICVTSELDPDPDPNELEWSFEPMSRPGDLVQSFRDNSGELPPNVTVAANILTIWAMSQQHSGHYKCSMHLESFNLTSEASSELVLQLQSDSAPLVFVSPELLRLSANGSGSIQCESTGYPVPQIEWYRVDVPGGEEALQVDGVEIRRIHSSDAMVFCEQFGCIAARSNQQLRVTSISTVEIKCARAKHQGQYVCRASNKHGSNQASSIVDVEYKAPPQVQINEQHRRQTIVLTDDLKGEDHNVTFKCSIGAGRPQPRLRWLRTSSVKLIRNQSYRVGQSQQNLDIFDLTKVSSATSKVSTWSEDGGKSLVLSISTVSIDDEGDYICLGENELGRHSSVAHLIVRKPAVVRILQASPKIARLNESFQLDCLASGHPSPIDIEWSRSDRGAFFALISRHAHKGGPERAVLKFDRISQDEAGEYTCAARDPLNSTVVLRDTIMLLVEDHSTNDMSTSERDSLLAARSRQLPKLMVRPTKINAVIGSNITLDCLALSGLQPTIVEWLAPSSIVFAGGNGDTTVDMNISIRPYYRPYINNNNHERDHLLQFGSKLRIFNASRSHEGVYQCKGRNKVGVENAPALVKIVPDPSDLMSGPITTYTKGNNQLMNDTKTKIAKLGSNIELRCQVNGVEQQPATSWSRDGRELPESSVQIEHNLWIQNLTLADEGLYLCSARSNEPNRIIQAKINLLVRGNDFFTSNNPFASQLPRLNLSAKIVASRSSINLGDSITLECILNYANKSKDIDSAELDELERQVIWTNLHSGESLFQDNVYVQNNLLIIYDLKPENSATYRCNYNDLTQHVDFVLQVIDPLAVLNNSQSEQQTSLVVSSTKGRRVQLRQASLGSRLVAECPQANLNDTTNLDYFWTRGLQHRKIDSAPLVFESLATTDGDLYQCHTKNSSTSVIVQVQSISAKFVQRPISFVTLPAISGADHQLELEIKFLPEHENGLLLFSGGLQTAALQQNLSNRSVTAITTGDYISLGLSRGHLEFRFELGDGPTWLRSLQPLALHQWHKVVIERNRRGAVMWLDGQPAISNSSVGKFFNLNLDSLLYVGGHQVFLGKRSTQMRFYGYSKGFQGCISSLRINRRQLELMARNRSVSVGVFECDRPECKPSDCSYPNGICQVDRSDLSNRKQQLSMTSSDLRCICLPDFTGPNCTDPQTKQEQKSQSANAELTLKSVNTTSQPQATTTLSNLSCEHINACNASGTQQCQSLSSTTYKCHCRLGFMGDTCSRVTNFTSESSIGFNQAAYLQFRFNTPQELAKLQQQPNQSELSIQASKVDLNQFVALTSFIDQQNISFKLRTRSDYGLIFYNGQNEFLAEQQPQQNLLYNSLHNGNYQASKSAVANLLARLSNRIADFMAIALVDGHVELSFELGSGLTIIRSSRRINDGEQHQIQVLRQGKLARLVVDETSRYEASSPGKLSMLNGAAEIYLGGLPQLQALANSTTSMLLSAFSGCISQLEINSLGPINLVRDDHLTQVKAARNLSPCSQIDIKSSDPTLGLTGQAVPTRVPGQKTTTYSSFASDADDPDELARS